MSSCNVRQVIMKRYIAWKQVQRPDQNRLGFVEVTLHITKINIFDIQPILFHQSVTQLVGARPCGCCCEVVMAKSLVGGANPFVGEREVRVKFDSSLIQGERCLRVTGEEKLGSLGACRECLQGGASRLFERLIESRQ